MKAYIAGYASDFKGQGGKSFQNKDEIASYCSQLWPDGNVKFVKSETKGTTWAVHPTREDAYKNKSKAEYAIAFDEFQDYMKQNALRQGKPGNITVNTMSEAQRAPDDDLQRARQDEATKKKMWEDNPSVENWNRWKESSRRVQDLERQQRRPQQQGGGSMVTYPENESDGSSRRNAIRSCRMSQENEAEVEVEAEGRKKKKRGRGRSRKGGKKSKREYATADGLTDQLESLAIEEDFGVSQESEAAPKGRKRGRKGKSKKKGTTKKKGTKKRRSTKSKKGSKGRRKSRSRK